MVKDRVESILRISGLSSSLKEHIKEHPQFAGMFDTDPTSPKHVVRKSDLAKLMACRIIPFLLESFSHLDDDDYLSWECGLFDDKRIDAGITVPDVNEAKEILTSLLEELE